MAKFYKTLTILLLAVFVIFQALPLIRSGLSYDFGIGYWGPNGHDAIWHLALIKQINNPFNISHPAISGQKLTNYHPAFDVLVAFVSKTTGLSVEFLYFQIFPLISSTLLVILSYKLGLILYQKQFWAVFLAFLVSFSGSFGWIITFIRNGQFGGESIFWSMQSASNQLNPPFSWSLILILVGLIIISTLRTANSRYSYLYLGLITLVIPLVKTYAGLLWYPLLLLFSISLHQSKIFKVLLVYGLIGIYTFILFNPSPKKLLSFSPFWFSHSMIESPDRLYWPKIASLRYNLALKPNFDKRLVLIELALVVVFFIGNFGFRTLGLLSIKRLINDTFYLPILIVSFLAFLIPLIFIQKGTAWNTIQFLYYSVFLFNLFLTKHLSSIKSKNMALFLAFLISILSILGNLTNYQNYFGYPPPSAVLKEEISGLKFLKNQPAGVVLSYPYDPYLKKSFTRTPIPLYAYETTAYLSAFTGKISYLADEMNLDISGYDWQSRRQQSLIFFNQQNPIENRGFLVNNQIDYIYLAGNQVEFNPTNLKYLSLAKIYDNGYSIIYKVNR